MKTTLPLLALAAPALALTSPRLPADAENGSVTAKVGEIVGATPSK